MKFVINVLKDVAIKKKSSIVTFTQSVTINDRGGSVIQTNPSNRLTMSKVLEMLEGGQKVLEIPPKPFLSSPSTSLAQLTFQTL